MYTFAPTSGIKVTIRGMSGFGRPATTPRL
jgi:hypothetical protein